MENNIVNFTKKRDDLIVELIPVALGVAKKYKSYLNEDTRSVAVYYLILAIDNLDKCTHDNKMAWVRQYIKHGILATLKNERKHTKKQVRHDTAEKILYGENLRDNNGDGGRTYYMLKPKKQSEFETFTELANAAKLTTKERLLLVLKIGGKTVQEIRAELKCGWNEYNTLLKSAQEKIKDSL